MRRIAIIGSGGSGKTTLATRLSKQLEIPVYHLDALFWQPGWVEAERQNWVKIQESICKQQTWIIDGNYGGTMDIRLRASDTIIFLDVNRFVCLYRAVRRTIKGIGNTRPDMGNGCEERLDLNFLKWIVDYPVKKKPGILKKLSALKERADVYVLKNQQDIMSFLSDLEKVEASDGLDTTSQR